MSIMNKETHTYELYVEGLKKVIDQEFLTRSDANEKMYSIAGKNHLNLIKVYNDNHYKTYIFSKGVKAYVSRI